MEMSRSADQAKWNINSVLQGVRSGGRQAARRTGRLTRDFVSSRWVQKVAIGTTLLAIAGTLLYIPAALGYLVLYYKFLPQLETTVPVHLQYGVGPNPFGIASVDGITSRQPYDITVSLTLPRSPTNLDKSNFMIALHLLSRGGPTTQQTQNQPLPYLLPTAQTPNPNPQNQNQNPPLDDPFLLLLLQPTRLNLPAFLATHTILYTTARPALIPYVDPLAALAARLLSLPFHMLFPRRAAATTLRLRVPMAEAVAFGFAGQKGGSGGRPERVLLEVQAGQDLQVYEAQVTLVARLRGLRGVMYRWRVAAFVVATVGFWLGEMVVLGTAVVLVLGWDLGGLLGGEGDEGEEEEGGGSDGGDYYGGEGKGRLVKAEFASSSSASAGEFGKGALKKEEEAEGDSEGELSRVPEFDPGQSTEADDEAESGAGKEKGKGKGVVGEEGSDAEDVGVGTSYGGQGGRAGARRRNISR